MNMTPGFPYRVVGKDAASQSTSSLGASKELQLFSLAEDGLDCIAGVGRSQINFSRVNFPEHIHPRCFGLSWGPSPKKFEKIYLKTPSKNLVLTGLA